jgi:hypothetical protein
MAGCGVTNRSKLWKCFFVFLHKTQASCLSCCLDSWNLQRFSSTSVSHLSKTFRATYLDCLRFSLRSPTTNCSSRSCLKLDSTSRSSAPSPEPPAEMADHLSKSSSKSRGSRRATHPSRASVTPRRRSERLSQPAGSPPAPHVSEQPLGGASQSDAILVSSADRSVSSASQVVSGTSLAGPDSPTPRRAIVTRSSARSRGSVTGGDDDLAANLWRYVLRPTDMHKVHKSAIRSQKSPGTGDSSKYVRLLSPDLDPFSPNLPRSEPAASGPAVSGTSEYELVHRAWPRWPFFTVANTPEGLLPDLGAGVWMGHDFWPSRLHLPYVPTWVTNSVDKDRLMAGEPLDMRNSRFVNGFFFSAEAAAPRSRAPFRVPGSGLRTENATPPVAGGTVYRSPLREASVAVAAGEGSTDAIQDMREGTWVGDYLFLGAGRFPPKWLGPAADTGWVPVENPIDMRGGLWHNSKYYPAATYQPGSGGANEVYRSTMRSRIAEQLRQGTRVGALAQGLGSSPASAVVGGSNKENEAPLRAPRGSQPPTQTSSVPIGGSNKEYATPPVRTALGEIMTPQRERRFGPGTRLLFKIGMEGEHLDTYESFQDFER